MKIFIYRMVFVLAWVYFARGDFDIEVFGLISITALMFLLTFVLVFTWRLWAGELEFMFNEIYI